MKPRRMRASADPSSLWLPLVTTGERRLILSGYCSAVMNAYLGLLEGWQMRLLLGLGERRN